VFILQVIWNIEFGVKVKSKEKQFKQKHQELLKKVDLYFEKFDVLFAPTVLVPPFEIEMRFAFIRTWHQMLIIQIYFRTQ
jgi:hypothetical protein